MKNSEQVLIDAVNTVNDFYDSSKNAQINISKHAAALTSISNSYASRLDSIASRYIAPSSISIDNPEYNVKFISDGNEYAKLEFNPAKIQSSIYEYEVFAMLETMKQIIIDSLGVSQEFFDNVYNTNKEQIQQKYDDLVTTTRVTNELLR